MISCGGLGIIVRIRALVIGLCWCAVLLLAQHQPQNLQDVRTIFVDSTGQGEFPNVLRASIVSHILSKGRFQVTLDPHDADAVLRVSVSEAQAVHQSKSTGGGRYDATVDVRMVSKDQQVLWVSATNGRVFSRTAASVGENVVKELLKAAEHPGKTKAK